MSIRRLLSILTLDALVVALIGIGHTAAAPSSCAPYQHCVYLPMVSMAGATYDYVVNAVTLPLQRTDFAIDLNGDGKVDNQLGNIIGALSSQGIDMQAAENTAIMSGTIVELVRFHTDDASLAADPNAQASLFSGVPTTPAVPNFSGTGVFTVDQTLRPGHFAGVLNSAFYSSTNPVVTTSPVSLTLRIALFSSSAPITLTVYGAHVQFHVATNYLLGGALQGSLPMSEVQTTLVPGIANALTLEVQQDPTSMTSLQIEAIFDLGGCTNPDGSSAQAGDHIISICEVANNTLIKNTLSPDVQIYDANGNYAPNPANTHRDSLSLAFGFTAVKAKIH